MRPTESRDDREEMDMCCCEGVEGLFDEDQAERDLRRYRSKGPKRTTRMLLDALMAQGVGDASVLDVGGGVGAIPHELLRNGAARATAVDASGAYVRAAQREAERRGHAERMEVHHGDFVGLAPEIQAHDVVTLDRSICCYRDMPALVDASAARAVRLYGMVLPRHAWWNRMGVFMVNAGLRLSGSAFRVFAHPTRAIERRLRDLGLERVFCRRMLVWQVEVYVRRSPSGLDTSSPQTGPV
jgi:magnesium-protoporphyrin O-methyltransferase